ncbi:MAG: ExbD/TolR family protein [Fibrobacterota bacterium]
MLRLSTCSRNAQTDEELGAFRPQLTSLIDVMVILLVFLLKNFSVEGQLITPDPDISLPRSTMEEEILPALSIQIRPDMILVEQNPIISTEEVRRANDMHIESLKTELESYFADRPDHRVMIHGDRSVPFEIVRKVMYTCSQAGVENFSVLVERQE